MSRGIDTHTHTDREREKKTRIDRSTKSVSVFSTIVSQYIAYKSLIILYQFILFSLSSDRLHSKNKISLIKPTVHLSFFRSHEANKKKNCPEPHHLAIDFLKMKSLICTSLEKIQENQKTKEGETLNMKRTVTISNKTKKKSKKRR